MKIQAGFALVLAATLSGCAGNAACEGACLTAQGLPAPTHRVAPQIPQLAIDAQVSGCTVVTFVIAPNGQANQVQFLESTPPGVFNQATLAELDQWRFEPAPDKPGRWAQRFEFRIDPKSTFPLACKPAPGYDELNKKKA